MFRHGGTLLLGATQSFVELCVDRLNQFAFVCWRRFGQMFPNRKKKTYLVNGMGGGGLLLRWPNIYYGTRERVDILLITVCVRWPSIVETSGHCPRCVDTCEIAKSSTNVPLQLPSSYFSIHLKKNKILDTFFFYIRPLTKIVDDSIVVGVYSKCISLSNRTKLFFFFFFFFKPALSAFSPSVPAVRPALVVNADHIKIFSK